MASIVSNMQIADLLVVARNRLVVCQYISEYPKKNNKLNFDTVDLLSSFYKNICNTFFLEALLITCNLLDNNSRTISFFNWDKCGDTMGKELSKLKSDPKFKALKTIRDQIGGHVDSKNRNNSYPLSRDRGIIEPDLLNFLYEIQKELLKIFNLYTINYQIPAKKYDPGYFNTSCAVQAVEEIMKKAEPKLTDNIIL